MHLLRHYYYVDTTTIGCVGVLASSIVTRIQVFLCMSSTSKLELSHIFNFNHQTYIWTITHTIHIQIIIHTNNNNVSSLFVRYNQRNRSYYHQMKSLFQLISIIIISMTQYSCFHAMWIHRIMDRKEIAWKHVLSVSRIVCHVCFFVIFNTHDSMVVCRCNWKWTIKI